MSIPGLDLGFEDFMSVFIVGFMGFLLQVIQTPCWVHCDHTPSDRRHLMIRSRSDGPLVYGAMPFAKGKHLW